MHHDLQLLLAHASSSFDTIELDCVVESNGELLQRAFMRSLPLSHGARVEAGEAAVIAAPDAQSRSGATSLHHERDEGVWWRRPDHWRKETVWSEGAKVVSIVRGDTASLYLSHQRTLCTNQRQHPHFSWSQSVLGSVEAVELPTVSEQLKQSPLIDPSFLSTGSRMMCSFMPPEHTRIVGCASAES